MIQHDTGPLAVAAATGILIMPPAYAAVYGFAGATVGIASMLITMYSAHELPSKKEWVKFIVTSFASIFLGVMVAYFAGPLLADVFKFESNTSPEHLVEFGLGLLAWRLIPYLEKYAVVKAKEYGAK